MMGREEEATKILLETDFQSGHYREDYLQLVFSLIVCFFLLLIRRFGVIEFCR